MPQPIGLLEDPFFDRDWSVGYYEPAGDPSPVTILLAEDDPAMRSLIARTLRNAGYLVIEVEDGRELRKKTRQPGHAAIIDLVISDIRMPGATGLEVLDRMRKTDWVTPVILITAFGDEAAHDKARLLGAAAVLDKPFDLEDLLYAVTSVVPWARL